MTSTRHFAAVRGSSRLGRVLAPWIAAALARQLAVSDFVAGSLERPPDAVLTSGVPASPPLWDVSNRTVVVMQRLEAEKDTRTALLAWELSGLADDGWTLRVVGTGTERTSLEALARTMRGVTFSGWTPTVALEFAQAGIFLAPTPADALGLGVLEAMAAGVPVVAAASGGHLETVGLLSNSLMFPPRDAAAAGAALRSLLDDDVRANASVEARALISAEFTIERHVDQLLLEYAAADRRSGRA